MDKSEKIFFSQITKIEFMYVTAAHFTMIFFLLFRQWKHLLVDNTEYKSFTFINRSLFLYINSSLNAKLMTIKHRESFVFLSLNFSAFDFIFYKLKFNYFFIICWCRGLAKEHIFYVKIVLIYVWHV